VALKKRTPSSRRHLVNFVFATKNTFRYIWIGVTNENRINNSIDGISLWNSIGILVVKSYCILPPFRNTCHISILSRGNSGILPKRHTICIELNESYS
jgi:hypothetical protein